MRHLFVRAMPALLVGPVAAMSFVLPTLAGASASSDRLDRLHEVRPIAAISNQLQQFQLQQFTPTIDAFGVAPIDPNLVVGPPIDAPPAPPVEEPPGSAPASRPIASTPNLGHCGGDVACFLTCTRAHESDSSGGYRAVSSDGRYRGAYQFLQATWDAAVAGAGFGEFVGVPAEQVPPEIQDAAAAFLYSVRGNAPWGGRC